MDYRLDPFAEPPSANSKAPLVKIPLTYEKYFYKTYDGMKWEFRLSTTWRDKTFASSIRCDFRYDGERQIPKLVESINKAVLKEALEFYATQEDLYEYLDRKHLPKGISPSLMEVYLRESMNNSVITITPELLSYYYRPFDDPDFFMNLSYVDKQYYDEEWFRKTYPESFL